MDKLLAVTTGTSTMNLLFANVGKTTEFLADLAAGDQSFNNGKYNITPEVTRKISDPKYNGFLLRQIAGIQQELFLACLNTTIGKLSRNAPSTARISVCPVENPALNFAYGK